MPGKGEEGRGKGGRRRVGGGKKSKNTLRQFLPTPLTCISVSTSNAFINVFFLISNLTFITIYSRSFENFKYSLLFCEPCSGPVCKAVVFRC